MKLLKLLSMYSLLFISSSYTMQTEKSEIKPLHRFPAFFYFLGMGPKVNVLPPDSSMKTQAHLPSPDFSKENIEITAIQHLEGNDLKIKFINFSAALVAAQYVLLNKPLTQWTVQDLQKLNGLLTLGIKPYDRETVAAKNYKPGHFLKERYLLPRDNGISADIVKSFNDRDKRLFQSILYKLVQPGEIAQLLTVDEITLFNKYYITTTAPKNIPSEMEALIAYIHSNADIDAFSLAAYAHNRVTKTRPFALGNGILARLIANIILMQHGITPFIVLRNKEYMLAVRMADGNIKFLTEFMKASSKAVELCGQKYRLHLCDFNKVDAHEPSNQANQIAALFEEIKIESETYEEELERLRQCCLASIGLV